MLDLTKLKNELKRDEGFEAKPYHDTRGKLTIGYGRNLTDVGITETEAEYLLDNNIQETVEELYRFDWFTALAPVRKRVLINMHFQLGFYGFNSFGKMIKALSRDNYNEAATEMLDSVWARRHNERATRLVKMMRKGEET